MKSFLVTLISFSLTFKCRGSTAAVLFVIDGCLLGSAFNYIFSPKVGVHIYIFSSKRSAYSRGLKLKLQSVNYPIKNLGKLPYQFIYYFKIDIEHTFLSILTRQYLYTSDKKISKQSKPRHGEISVIPNNSSK